MFIVSKKTMGTGTPLLQDKYIEFENLLRLKE